MTIAHFERRELLQPFLSELKQDTSLQQLLRSALSFGDTQCYYAWPNDYVMMKAACRIGSPMAFASGPNFSSCFATSLKRLPKLDGLPDMLPEQLLRVEGVKFKALCNKQCAEVYE